MKCGQVLLVDFPFTDDSGSKVRPILVVSADYYNQGDDIVVVPISSAPDPHDPFTFPIDSGAAWFRATGLRLSSSVKWTKPLTISHRVVQRRLGNLASRPLAEVQSKVQGIFQA